MGRFQEGELLTFENRTKCMITYSAVMPDPFSCREKTWEKWKQEYEAAMKIAAEKDRVLNYE